MKGKFANHLDIKLLNVIHIPTHREMSNAVLSSELGKSQGDKGSLMYTATRIKQMWKSSLTDHHPFCSLM